MNINISIKEKVATVSGSPVIICGNSDYTVTFTFDSEWDNLPTKQARFSWYLNGEKQHTDVTFTGSTVTVPTLSDITALYVGVFAGDLHTTTPAKITCRYSALCGSGTKMLKGETGDAATVDVGTVTTAAPGTEAKVENVGTRGAAVLNFKIPAGQTSLASFATLSMASAPTVGKELAIAYSRLNRTPLVGEYGFSLCVDTTTGNTYMMAFQVQSLNATTAAAKVTAVTSTTGPQGEKGEKGEKGDTGLSALYRHMISLYDQDETSQQTGYLFIVTNGATPFTVAYNSSAGYYEIIMGEDSTFIFAARWYNSYADYTYSVLLNTGADDLVPCLMNVGYITKAGAWSCINLHDRLTENSTDTVEAIPTVATTTALNTEV